MGFRAMYYRFPEHKVGIAILCNRADARTAQLAELTADVFLSEKLMPKPQEVIENSRNMPGRIRQRYAGNYRNLANAGRIELIDQDKMILPTNSGHAIKRLVVPQTLPG